MTPHTAPAEPIDAAADALAGLWTIRRRTGISFRHLALALDTDAATLRQGTKGKRVLPPDLRVRILHHAMSHALDGVLRARAPVDGRALWTGQAGRPAVTSRVWDRQDLGAFLRRWNLKPAQLARWKGLSPTTVSAWEAGRQPIPNDWAEDLRDFDGNVMDIPVRSVEWHCPDTSRVVQVFKLKLEDPQPRGWRGRWALRHFHPDALLAATRSAGRADVLRAVWDYADAVKAMEAHPRNPDNRSDFWARRRDVESLLAPFLPALGLTADYRFD